MKTLKYFFLIVASAFLLLFFAGDFLISNPKTCIVCHEMKEYYESWKASNHSTAAKTCTDCHSREGLKERILLRFYIVGEFLFARGSRKVPHGIYLPSSDNCVKIGCHALNRMKNPSNTIKIDHRLHTQQMKISCADCHKRVVHSKTNFGIKEKPSVKICMDCHSSQSLTCSYCHLKPVEKNFRH